MEFKTSISKITEDDMILRKQKHSDLIKNKSFAYTIFLLLSGQEPNETEEKIFNAMLVSIIDHGMGTTSSLTTRFVMSGGNPLNAAVGAGVQALGDCHGGAIEKAMEQLQEITNVEEFVTKALKHKKIIYGFGHKIYKQEDPRVKVLLKICQELKYTSQHIDKALEIEKTIEQQKDKKICLNIDGLIAAILLEMGFSPNIGKGFFIIGRVPGLVAQAVEEKENEKPVRRIDEEDISYQE